MYLQTCCQVTPEDLVGYLCSALARYGRAAERDRREYQAGPLLRDFFPCLKVFGGSGLPVAYLPRSVDDALHRVGKLGGLGFLHGIPIARRYKSQTLFTRHGLGLGRPPGEACCRPRPPALSLRRRPEPWLRGKRRGLRNLPERPLSPARSAGQRAAGLGAAHPGTAVRAGAGKPAVVRTGLRRPRRGHLRS